MSEAENTRESGSWRKGEFVRWQDLFAPVEGFLVWFGLVSLTLAAAMAINAQTGHSNTGTLHFYTAAQKDFDSRQILLVSVYLVVLFFLWRVTQRVSKEALVAYYRSIHWPTFLAALLGGVLLAVATMFAIEELARRAVVTFHSSAAERSMLPPSPASIPFALLLIALAAPFVEELYFRGVLLSWLRRKMFAPLAAILSAVIFAALHFRFINHPGADGWIYTGAIAFVGLINAILALRTRSLWGPFAVHAGYNATLVSSTVWLPLLFR